MREEALAAGLLAGKTQTQAAIDAGYSPARAGVTASEKVRDVGFRETLRALAQERGIDAGFAIDKLVGLINQNQVLLMGRDKSEPLEVPDGATRAKGVDMLLKVLGAYPDPRMEVTGAVATVVVRATEMMALDPFADVVEGEVVEADRPGQTL